MSQQEQLSFREGIATGLAIAGFVIVAIGGIEAASTTTDIHQAKAAHTYEGSVQAGAYEAIVRRDEEMAIGGLITLAAGTGLGLLALRRSNAAK